MRLRETAFRNPDSYFHRYATDQRGRKRWILRKTSGSNINLKNLHQNILPTRPRADLILQKGENHLIETVALRKL